MMRATIFFIALLVILMMTAILVGCDKEINRYVTEDRVAEETIGCSYSCPHYGCSPSMDFDGNFTVNCGMQNDSCRGSQRADVRRYHLRVTYESERERNSEEMEVVKRLTECR